MRRASTFPLLLAIAVLSTPTAATPPPSPPDLTPQDAALLTEALHQWHSLGPAVWPGLDKLQSPILYIKPDHEYLIGFPTPPADSTELRQRIAGRAVHVRTRRHSPQLSASFYVDGHSVAVMGTPEALERSPARWVLTTLHEMFHVFQHSNGSGPKIDSLNLQPDGDTNASWQLNYPFPYKNQDVMNLIHLQGYPLFLATNETSVPDRFYNLTVALEARSVYHGTLKSLGGGDDRFYRYSLFQEWTEGVAFYVEYLFAKAAVAASEPTEPFRRHFGPDGYRETWEAQYKTRPFLAKHAGRAARSRTAFYHLGLAKALALDQLMPDWKAQYFTPGLWLDQLLEESLKAAMKRPPPA